MTKEEYQSLNKLAILIEYDGTGYSGWQKQKNALSVQEMIERAFFALTGSEMEVIGSGRTDAGVHASGQVAHVVLPENYSIPVEKSAKALNSVLPLDIRARRTELAPPDFHARFRAEKREYRYRIRQGETVFHRRYEWQIFFPFEPRKLNDAAQVFVGEHDFTTFSKRNDDVESYVCNVSKCEWTEVAQDVWELTIQANRFVYSMVRSLVGAMVGVASGKRTVEDVQAALVSLNRKQGSPIAPAQGLVLSRVFYPQDPFEKYRRLMEKKSRFQS